MKRNLDIEARLSLAEGLHRELAERLRGLGVEAGDRPLRLSVAELARLLGDQGYEVALEARDGEGRNVTAHRYSRREEWKWRPSGE
jgi:hypothetical protein